MFLGLDPTKRLIGMSYSQDLATKLSNDCREVMSSSWYRRLFPKTKLSRLKNTETEFATTQMGYRVATSIEGTLTGRGGDIIILDDPLKPVDALSDSRRERVNNAFFSTIMSRLDDKRTGFIIIVMHRLHEDDLVGRLLREAPGAWTVLSLPDRGSRYWSANKYDPSWAIDCRIASGSRSSWSRSPGTRTWGRGPDLDRFLLFGDRFRAKG